MRAARPIRPFPLVILSLVVLLASCRGGLRYPRSLTLADSLTECCPDSAIRYLDRLRPAMDGADEADRMYYRLLCVKAADKAYIPHTSDSLIRPVLDYYEQGGDARLLPVARYYAGRVSMDLGDAPQALAYFQDALDAMTGDEQENTLKGVIYSQMGILQIRTSFYGEAVNSLKNALVCFAHQKDTVRILYTLNDIGSALNFMGKRKAALDTLLSAKRLMTESHLLSLPIIDNQMARTYLYLNQPDSAKKYITLAIANSSVESEMTDYTIAATIYKHLNIQDSVRKYSELLKDGDLINQRYALRLTGEIELERGNWIDASNCYRKWADINDSVDEMASAHDVARMNSIYNYQLRVKENERLHEINRKKAETLRLMSLAVVSLIVIMTYHFRYQRKKRAALALKLEKYERMVEEYKFALEEEETKRKGGIDDFQKSDLYWALKENASKNEKMTNEQIKELSNYIGEKIPRFQEELSKLTKISSTNYLICMLVAVKFSTSEIATLMCKTPQAINSARQRLYEKAFGEKGNPQKWDNIIFSLSKC